MDDDDQCYDTGGRANLKSILGPFLHFLNNTVLPEYDWSPNNLGPNGNIDIWLIYNDRLFFFLDDTPKTKFEEDPQGCLMDGTNRWNEWFGSRESSPFNTACVASES